jgi:GNAT superfamily N-acetyltransferase
MMERAFGGLEGPDPPAQWDWLFVRNPATPRVHYAIADAGGHIAGQYAMLPLRLIHEARETVGLLSLYTATDPEFQGQGIMTTLARHVYDDARDEAPIVFGFPNPNSAPVFYSKLGWFELRPFPLLLRPLHSLRAIAAEQRPKLEVAGAAAGPPAAALALSDRARAWTAARRGVTVRRVEALGGLVGPIWDAVADRLGTCAIRDDRYVRWRFDESPFTYRKFVATRGDEVVGFAVTTIAAWHGTQVAHLMELLALPRDHVAGRSLAAAVCRDAALSGAVAVLAIVTPRHPQRRELLRAGFLPVPTPFKSMFSFGVRVNGSGVVPNRLLHIDDWHLSGADLDYL